MTAPPLNVQFIRHARVPHHRGDVPVTELGLQEAEEAARRIVAGLDPQEIVILLHTATLRSRETAYVLDRIMRAHPETHPSVTFRPPREEPAIRNPDLYIGGMRVEMVSTADAMAEQTQAVGLGPDVVGSLSFYRDFFHLHDRIGYWIQHPGPPGENAEAVARRMMTFAISLTELRREHPTRYLCITHSPLMRAFAVQYVLDEDQGEPEFMESIDLTFTDATFVMRYRDREVSLQLPT